MLQALKYAIVFIFDMFILLAVASWGMEFSQQTLHLNNQLSLILGMGSAIIAFAHLKFRHKFRN